MSELSEIIDPLDADAEKRRALQALQEAAGEVSDHHLHKSEQRNAEREGAPVSNAESQPNVPGIHSPAERPETTQIPLSGGIPELQDSLLSSTEMIDVVDSRVESALRGTSKVKPKNAIDDLGVLMEQNDNKR
jgi:hypothetical protein